MKNHTAVAAAHRNFQRTRPRRISVYHLPACATGKAFAVVLITSRGDALDTGDNRKFPFTISAREIAEDLLQGLGDHGVFVCAGARPTADELSDAANRRDQFYQCLVTDGDTMGARGHSFREVSDLHRRAAIALGAEREWAYVPVRMSDCPACGEKVKPGIAVCKHCGAILHEDKAAKHGWGRILRANDGLAAVGQKKGRKIKATRRCPRTAQPSSTCNEGPARRTITEENYAVGREFTSRRDSRTIPSNPTPTRRMVEFSGAVT